MACSIYECRVLASFYPTHAMCTRTPDVKQLDADFSSNLHASPHHGHQELNVDYQSGESRKGKEKGKGKEKSKMGCFEVRSVRMLPLFKFALRDLSTYSEGSLQRRLLLCLVPQIQIRVFGGLTKTSHVAMADTRLHIFG